MYMAKNSLGRVYIYIYMNSFLHLPSFKTSLWLSLMGA